MTTQSHEAEPPDVSVADLSDAALLTDFCETGNEAGFRAIVQRHARMVSSVCTAVLGNRADAEDAFQATFFVLARKASGISKKESLVAWLHRVALRSALAARKRIARRKTTELPPEDALPQGSLEKVSTRATILALHEQLDRLPEKYRTPLIVCYLQGEERAAAAKRLKISEAALHKRVQRGRTMLRRRLGVLGIAGITVASLSQAVSAGTTLPSASVLNSTVLVAAQVRIAWANGLLATSGQQASLTLAQGVLKTMFMTTFVKSTMTMILGASVGLVAISAMAIAQEPNSNAAGVLVTLADVPSGPTRVQDDDEAQVVTENQQDEEREASYLRVLDASLQDLRKKHSSAQGYAEVESAAANSVADYLRIIAPRQQAAANSSLIQQLLAQRAIESALHAQSTEAAKSSLELLPPVQTAYQAALQQMLANRATADTRSTRLEQRIEELEQQLEIYRENMRLQRENAELRKQVEELKRKLGKKD
ncbi:MAG: sigma-70 family RNA polymerase sigma factor [Pirellulales bacterium]|nr:sigma-70 family RNA polymerase sigma factor [Pirellulales bacterium]